MRGWEELERCGAGWGAREVRGWVELERCRAGWRARDLEVQSWAGSSRSARLGGELKI